MSCLLLLKYIKEMTWISNQMFVIFGAVLEGKGSCFSLNIVAKLAKLIFDM